MSKFHGPVHYNDLHVYGDVTDVMRSMRVGATAAADLIWRWARDDFEKAQWLKRHIYLSLEEAYKENAWYDAKHR